MTHPRRDFDLCGVARIQAAFQDFQATDATALEFARAAQGELRMVILTDEFRTPWISHITSRGAAQIAMPSISCHLSSGVWKAHVSINRQS